ncbi:four helix bundle protein [Patescibacteria group bacterium]|nr:four helix bundle protein [Patescibacteria group bacterium]
MNRTYEKLVAWKEAHDLCLWVYRASRKFPSEEKYGLTSQMRRAAYSVPMNIAEGNARRSSKEKARFFEISLASLEELHYQCRLACDLDYINKEQFQNAHDRISRTNYLITKLRTVFLKHS